MSHDFIRRGSVCSAKPFLLEELEPRRLLAAPALAGLYHTFAPFSQPRESFATATVGDDVLFAGGDFTDAKNNFILSDAVDIYHATTGQWTSAKLSQARTETFQVVVAGTWALFIGGRSGVSYNLPAVNAIDVFDTATNLWTTIALPHPRDNATAVAVGDQVVFAGGFVQIGGQLATSTQVDIYHTVTGQWTSATLSQPTASIDSAVVGSTAIFSGNSEGNIDVYNSATGIWSHATLPGTGAGAVVAVAGKLAVFSSSEVDLFDPATSRWSTTAIPSTDFRARPHAVVGNKVVFDGGSANLTVPYDDAVFDVVTRIWTHQAVNGINDPSFTAVGTKAIFAGGRSPSFMGFSSYTSGIKIYDAATDQWSQSPVSLSEARADLAAFTEGPLAVFGPGHGSFFGAPTNNVDVYNDLTGVWSTTTLDEYRLGLGATSADGQLLFAAFKGVDLFVPSAITEPANPSPATEGGTASLQPTLTWDASPQASGYDVYLDDALVAHVTSSHWTVDHALVSGHHAWQIVAHTATSFTAGPRWTFDIGAPSAPTDPTPPNGAALSVSPPTLSWQPASGASSYDVYLDGTLFGNVASPHTLLGQLLPGGTHTWRIVSRNGLTTTTGPTRTFSTPTSGLTHSTKILSNTGDITAVTVDHIALFASNASQGYRANSTAVDLYDSSTRSWSTGSLSQARGNITTATLGHKAIFAGGELNRPLYSDAVDIFNAATHRWSIAKLSFARDGMTTATVSGEVVFAGASTLSDTVDIYHDRTGKWSTARLSEARFGIASVSAGHFAFFAGGTRDTLYGLAPYSNVVDIYDARRHRWSTARLSVARSNVSAVTVGTKVIFAGGYIGHYGDLLSYGDKTLATSDVVDIFDLATGRWSTSKLPEARFRATSVVIGQRVIFTGGSIGSTYEHPNGDSDVAEIYDVKNNHWSTAKLAELRSYESVVRLGTRVLIAGGLATNGGQSNVIDVFDTQKNSWTIQTLSTVSFPGQLAGTAVGDVAIFVTGSGSSENRGTIADLYSSL